MLRIFFSTLFLFLFIPTHSQIQVSDAGILFQSRHVWRGEKLGTAPAIEPSVTFSANRFSFNVWSSVTTNNSYSEIDLIPAYQFNNFQLTLLDYYNPETGESNQYLNFQEGRSRHSLEVTFDNYSVDKQHFKWLVGTFLMGDKNDETGNPFYSTYLEFKYPFTFLKIDVEPFFGITPFKGLYAEKIAIINSGITFCKEFDLKLPFTIPLSLSFISNPNTKQSFVIFAGGIAF